MILDWGNLLGANEIVSFSVMYIRKNLEHATKKRLIRK